MNPLNFSHFQRSFWRLEVPVFATFDLTLGETVCDLQKIDFYSDAPFDASFTTVLLKIQNMLNCM